jgi:hypothetical protein
MRFDIAENSVSPEQVMQDLQRNFPEYQFKYRSKNLLICKKHSWNGCNILVGKKRLTINPTFPEMYQMLIFVLSLVLLGFLIPLIVYLLAFHGKLKQTETEIGNYLKQKYEVSGK